MWRIVVNENLNETLINIQTTWSIDDLADAHDALDYIECRSQEADDNAERESKRGRRH